MTKKLTLEQCRAKMAKQEGYALVYIDNNGKINIDLAYSNKKDAINGLRKWDTGFYQNGAVVRFFENDIMREE